MKKNSFWKKMVFVVMAFMIALSGTSIANANANVYRLFSGALAAPTAIVGLSATAQDQLIGVRVRISNNSTTQNSGWATTTNNGNNLQVVARATSGSVSLAVGQTATANNEFMRRGQTWWVSAGNTTRTR